MGKGRISYRSSLFKRGIRFTASEELNSLKGKVFAPQELEAANDSLKKLKGTLPDQSVNNQGLP